MNPACWLCVFCFNFSYELTEDSQSIGSSSFGQASLLLVSICLHPSPSHESLFLRWNQIQTNKPVKHLEYRQYTPFTAGSEKRNFV